MPECFACGQEITDLKDEDVLKIIGINNNDSRRLLDAFHYIPSNRPGLNYNYIHFRCASKHADHLAPHHRNEWLEWRVRQLEQQQKENRTLMEDITSAIKYIDTQVYYKYIEEPSLNRREKRQHDRFRKPAKTGN